ncbi:MAG: helicase [Deltaproteobacteria bacterium]|nr:helicase [Deltaproteobacteria bacterium]
MRLIRNGGSERVVDDLRRAIGPDASLDVATPAFSLHAFAEVRDLLSLVSAARLIFPPGDRLRDSLMGGERDRVFRNRLLGPWLARECSAWAARKVEVRSTAAAIPQSVLIARDASSGRGGAVVGDCPFTTEGLGITPGNPLALVHGSAVPEDVAGLVAWFDEQWRRLPDGVAAKEAFLAALADFSAPRAPSLLYHLVLFHLLGGAGDGLDEDRVVDAATGIRNTVVWRKLYRFQRDGVVGAIDKLAHHGGCIIADSVGLGKTFEALAVIKYHELRNDRVLVLCPKRLRDNWTLYRSNDRRNVLAADRFHYDVLNHTDLSRGDGLSGDIDLAHVNWGNYDLLVIDESHNFRNKATRRDRETRYDRLMRDVIRQGVKTRVLMLSATPVNNRLADLKNQIAFATEGDDAALRGHGIGSVEATVRQAQAQFNRWLTLPDSERKPPRLLDMLGFDYFRLLDLVTIARSRKHLVKYYGTVETGRFPERLKPVNLKADVDLAGEFPAIRVINDEIRRLSLAAYAPLKYVLPHRQAAYEAAYNIPVKGGGSVFRQADREESLVQLMRVNLLKRMESSVVSFALTLERQLADVDAMIARLDAPGESFEDLDISDVDIDDPAFEPLLLGRKVKVLVRDVDRRRWRQDLTLDRNRLATLQSAASAVDPGRDAKLSALREVIREKCRDPINPGNRKLLVFTAFADTAEYLFRELSGRAVADLGLHCAIVTGTGANRTTLPGLATDLGAILTAFSPRSKERPADLAGEGEIDLLVATDCISEGQNLQDCDCLVNYDIHWNPVRIIQRFGRIDRIGSPNERVRLVNFWPNMEMEEYINLEQRVSGKMVLLDISATGEENLIEHQSGDRMNDLEYRRKQLLKLQEAVIDLEDLSSGVSIADLTFNDFRMDLSSFAKEHPDALPRLPLGSFAVMTANAAGAWDAAIPPGVVFCLRAEEPAGGRDPIDPGYPLAPHFLVHVGDDGAVVLPYTQAKPILDRLRRTCLGRDLPDLSACERLDRATRGGMDMARVQALLARAVASVAGKAEERATASLFSPGGTTGRPGEFRGMDAFEVVAFLVVLPEAATGPSPEPPRERPPS